MICRNLNVNGRRASVRMEKNYWDALEDVAQRRGISVSALACEVDVARGDGTLTDGLRLAALTYFRGLVDQLDQYGVLRAATANRPRPRFRRSTHRDADRVPVVMLEHVTLQ